MKKFFLIIFLSTLVNCQVNQEQPKSFFEKAKTKVSDLYSATKEAISARLVRPVSERVVQKVVNEVNAQSKKVLEKFKSSAIALRQVILKQEKPFDIAATARTGSAISENEKIFLKNRSEVVKRALEKLEIKAARIPKIAVCASGGGVRASVGFLGFLVGLEKNNILDTTTYISALSGSTWTLAPWLIQGSSLNDFKKYLKDRVAKGMGPIAKGIQIQKFIRALLTKVLFLQSITTVDIYGGLLANFLLQSFDPERHKVHFSSLIPKLLKGSIPMPICTAVMTGLSRYEWFEFNPFEVGSSFLNTYIPSWSFGREFANGKSTDFAPEQSLGYLLGIFGSAFEVNLQDLIRLEEEAIKEESRILYEIMNTLEKTMVGEVRLWPASVYNFSYKLNGSPLKNKKNISLIDAGIDFNLPIPPLLERDLDLIIIFDASRPHLTEFTRTIEILKKRGHKFPQINSKKLSDKRITVFENNVGPIIIYMPLYNENGEYLNGYDWRKEKHGQTSNFKYTNEEFEKMAGLSEFNVEKSSQVIIDTIRKISENPSIHPSF
ncbi:hypothetical protein M1446_00460 [Candidatus Dependentiae bacterium]|nr:hypothetical protein [Candidatus Dependentiae bacterium]